MSTLVIKNLPPEIHDLLKLRAERNHRSLTREAIAVLEAAVRAPEARELTATAKLDALFAAGDALASQGVDFAGWAGSSREVWR